MIKCVKKITAMAICLAIGISATAYALPESNSNAPKNPNNNEAKNEANGGNEGNDHHHHHKGKVLEKLGITKQELEEAQKSGKSFFDIAKEKGHNEQDVKRMMIEDRNNYIDQAVKDKKITKEKADQIKNMVNEKIKNWDGSLKDKDNSSNKENQPESNGTKENKAENNGAKENKAENNKIKENPTKDNGTQNNNSKNNSSQDNKSQSNTNKGKASGTR